jgi:oligopeptide transport system permease protein
MREDIPSREEDTMSLEQGPDQQIPPHLESLATTGVAPFPPTAGSLKDYGPLADTPEPSTAATQSELDLQAEQGSVERITEGQSLSPIQASLRRLGRDRRAMVCIATILFIVVVSYVFPFFYLKIGPVIQGGLSGNTPTGPDVYHQYTHQELLLNNAPGAIQQILSLKAPDEIGLAYPMGTDQLGRDVFARTMAGINVSIQIALLVEMLDITLGLTIGTLAGFFGGWVDTGLARFTDVMFAFPGLLLVIMAAATLGPVATAKFGLVGRLLVVALVLGVTIWPQMARFVRGQTLQIKEQQYIEASRTVGGNNRHLVLSHIVPNLFSIVIAAATLNIVGVITGEAVISLLGLGVQPPGSSLGLMINEGIQVATSYPFEALFPSLILILLVVCFAFFGDGVRDAFDPRTKD